MNNGVILTYDNLKANLILNAARPNDANLPGRIDFFILYAQTELCSLLNVLPTEKTVVGELTPGQGYIPKPALWNKTVSFQISNPDAGNQITTLKKYPTEYVEMFNAGVGRAGIPEIYSEESQSIFLIAPAPMQLPENKKFNYKIKYSILFEPLNETVQTNIFTERYPNLLNYACSYQMFLALNSRDFKNQYTEALQQAIAGAKNIDIKDLSERTQDFSNN